MDYTFLILCLGIIQVSAFPSVTNLRDCPKIFPQNEIELNKVAGTWRLAYLFIDDVSDLEEDNTCGVVEIMKMNETNLEILLYIDSRKDEFTLERYTKQFDVTAVTPGEWIIHTSFLHIEFIHASVIGFVDDHLILTFCINPFSKENLFQSPGAEETTDNRDIFSESENKVDTVNDIFKVSNYQKLFKDFNSLNNIMEKRRLAGLTSRLYRDKRRAKVEKEVPEGLAYQKMIKYFSSSSVLAKKHLWTAILAKDNKVSALEFVENASLLMRYGFNISRGQLVSFGSCALSK